MIGWLRDLLSFRGEKPSVTVVGTHTFRLDEPLPGGGCYSSYFLRGTHGNYLVGMPWHWRAFQKFFKDQGGVAYVLPTTAYGRHDDEVTLFERFGVRWIVPDQLNFGHVPVSDPTQPYPDWAGLNCVVHDGAAVQWSGTFRGTHFTTATDLKEDSVSFLSFRSSHGGEFHGQQVSTIVASLSTKLGETHLISHHIPGSPFLILFDDYEYEAQDLDLHAPKNRGQLLDALREAGGTQVSGRHVSYHGYTIHVPGSQRQHMGPSIDSSEIYLGYIYVLTPTQAAYEVVKHWRVSTEKKQKALLALASCLPFNLSRLQQLTANDAADFWTGDFVTKLTAELKECSSYYRQFKPKGALGRIRKPTVSD